MVLCALSFVETPQWRQNRTEKRSILRIYYKLASFLRFRVMGIPTDIFLTKPSDSLVCVICHDVLEEPQSLLKCGHTFCLSCIVKLQGPDPKKCPTCRQPINANGSHIRESLAPVQPLRQMIGNLEIRCRTEAGKHVGTNGVDDGSSSDDAEERSMYRPNNHDNDENDDEDADERRSSSEEEEEQISRKRRRRTRIARDNHRHHCGWKGKVSDWLDHAKTECRFFEIPCEVPGCFHVCQRKDMPKHMAENVTTHTELVVRSICPSGGVTHLSAELENQRAEFESRFNQQQAEFEARLDQQHEEFEERLDAVKVESRMDLVNYHLTSFCRQWSQRRPDALYDFAIYRPNTPKFTRLCCYIPGPKRTPWQGGMFPLFLEWRDINRLPDCRLPTEFFHDNVRRSTGTISPRVFNPYTDDGNFAANLSIPELMFIIQRMLAHPDPTLCLQTTASGIAYDELIEKQAIDFPEFPDGPPSTLHFGDSDNDPEEWVLVNDQGLMANRNQAWAPQRRPQEPIIALDAEEEEVEEENDDEEDGGTTGTLKTAESSVLSVGTTELPGTCRCSCCVWSASFWDSRREMRFLLP